MENEDRQSPAGSADTETKRPKYQKIEELDDLRIPFRDFFRQVHKERPDLGVGGILNLFNDRIAPRTFYPYPANLYSWTRKWKRELELELVAPTQSLELIKPPTDAQLIPKAEDLEGGTDTLAGALLNDAYEILQSDKEAEEFFTPDELIKRKNYALNVMTHVSKIMQGKQGLALKANAEKRETVNFMMDLMKRATAGNLKPEEVAEIKKAFAPTQATVTIQQNA